MIFGGSGRSGEGSIPSVATIGLRRPIRRLPRSGEPLSFQVTVHVEGVPLTWVSDAVLSARAERELLDGAEELLRFSAGRVSASDVQRTTRRVGRQIGELLLGRGVREALDDLAPSAVMLDVDETVLNLPWDLAGALERELALEVPLGRLVSSRVRPRPRRNPVGEDRVVRLLAVGDPTGDLPAAGAEVDAIAALSGPIGPATLEVTVLRGAAATRGHFDDLVRDGRFDVVHFAGHGRFDLRRPGESAIVFADGPSLRADDVASIPWSQPPYVVFNSACESARSGGNRRLVSRSGSSSGLAAAFLAAGVQGYLGYSFVADDVSAAAVADAFYSGLCRLQNVGMAVLEARRSARSRFDQVGDLAAFGLTYVGDAGGAHRADLATAV